MMRNWPEATSLMKHFIVFVAILTLGGFLLVLSGIVPIKASSGHWALTRWILDFAKQRSVATHAWNIQTPPLADPLLVVRGAGSYETSCRQCHGSPLLPNPVFASRATPVPPYLPLTLSEWEDAELFYIVKHGIKLTAMPAWPAQTRDDEVWAMVAFLRTLRSLDAAQYSELTAAGLSPPDENGCQRCHGNDGLGRNGAFPKLAGQRPLYFENALQSFASEQRRSGVMAPVAAELTPEQIRESAAYYAKLEIPPDDTIEDKSAIERGRAIATLGIPAQRVPSCEDCHGPGGVQHNPAYPRLAGQYAEYLVLQLELFKENRRGGSAYAHLMQPIAARLSPEQMRDVAGYYASVR